MNREYGRGFDSHNSRIPLRPGTSCDRPRYPTPPEHVAKLLTLYNQLRIADYKLARANMRQKSHDVVEKQIIKIDVDKLAHDILYNAGNYQFVISPQGELFDCSSTASPDDLRLPLPVVPQDTSGDRGIAALSLAETFFHSLNLPTTWQNQSIDGKLVLDVFEFIEIPF